MSGLEFTGEFIVMGKTPFEYLQEHLNRYFFASMFGQGKTVLDISCGSGYGSDYLMKTGAQKVIGVDISKEAMKYAIMHYRGEELSFLRSDATKLPLHDDSFDIVVSFETIEHLNRYKDFLCECRRVLKGSGLFIYSTPNKEILSPFTKKPRNPFHIKEFYINEFHDLLKESFFDITLHGQCFIGLKAKIKTYLFGMGELLLSILPKGSSLINLIEKRLFKNKRVLESEKKSSDEKMHPKYKVFPFQNNLPKTPTYIIAVAKKPSNKKKSKGSID